MVNEEIHIKDEILKILFSAKAETVSGVRLSEMLNISRVAVWKHISALKEAGVHIGSRPRGYVLPNPEDLLFPFCLRPDSKTGFSISRNWGPPWIRPRCWPEPRPPISA
nr:HTH domain-containing protein [Desulfobacula sp.]